MDILEHIKTWLLIFVFKVKELTKMFFYFLSWPFQVIKIVIQDYKFERSNPDFWTKYIEKRRIESETEEAKRRNDINFARGQVAINVGVMEVCMIDFVERQNPKRRYKKRKLSPEEIEGIFQKAMQVALENYEQSLKLGAQYNGDFPEKLKALTVSSCKTRDEINQAIDQVLAILNDYEFGPPANQ